ncbi:MAG: hypothetical protein JO253_04705 [Alphaproteobacteria bacterium]|nr:hypothetical protein [Alphaproteobacteria bacterium]
MDLTTIPDEVLLARGKYSTVRAEHEDAKKSLQILCGKLTSAGTQLLRMAQPDGDGPMDTKNVSMALQTARNTIGEIESCIAYIDSLAIQRAELKPIAWRK